MRNAKSIICLLLAGVLLFGFVGCAPRVVQTDFENLAYGEDEQQVMDLYFPTEYQKQLPVIVLIHGGEWVRGDKSTFSQTAKEYTQTFGVIAASINYRYLSQTTQPDAIMDDISSALEKIKQAAASQGIQVTNCALGGHSAGSHLAMLYAYSMAETAPLPIGFVWDSSGPTDLTDAGYFAPNNILGADRFEYLFSLAIGEEFSYEEMQAFTPQLNAVSPIFYVNENTVPTIICHGMRDPIVPFTNAQALDARMTEYGVEHQFIAFPNSSHGLDNDPDCTERLNEVFAQYVAEYLF